MTATLIKNGTIVTGSDTYPADLLIEGGTIASIGPRGKLQPAGAEVIDAGGRYVMPGGIDVHTHLDMPFMGTTSSDDFETGTRAAAFGGTTCLIDFAIPEKWGGRAGKESGKPMREALERWQAKAEGKAVFDYGFHMCIVEWTDRTRADLDAMVEEGITSFKLFTDYPGVFQIDDGCIFRALRWARERGALIQVHAVNGPATAILIEEAAAEGRLDPVYHGLCRPSRLEGEATSRMVDLAEVAGAPVYIVHLTCAEALAAVRDGRRRGVKVFAETCPQYLYLSHDDLARPDFEGAKYICNPPIRPAWHAPELWKGLRSGDLQTVATDHCPFNFKGQKEMGRGDFRKIPNGLPGLETRVPLIHQGVVDGHITLNQLVDVCSTAPAKLFGLYPRKGAVVVGADADLVLWDPEKQTDLSVKSLHMRVDHSIYEGVTVKGGPDKVLVRGEVIVDGAEFRGRAGAGRYLRREPVEL
jgi:dihydropyrimidinase